MPEPCRVERFDVPNTLTITTFCRAYQRAWCRVQTTWFGIAPEDLPCEDADIERADALCSAERMSVLRSGEGFFDALAAAECVDTLIEEQCSPALDVPACRMAFNGMVAMYSACDPEAPVETCAAGLYCQKQLNECGGRCLPFLEEGADCYRTGVRCEPGLSCAETSLAVCAADDSALPAVGELGDPCLEHRQCPALATEPHSAGFWIAETSCVAGFCRVHSYEDGPCGLGACPDDLVCSSTESATVPGGRCVPPFATGSSCRDEAQCASGRCFEDRCIVPAAVGSACRSGAQCASGVCRSERCVSLLADGEACTAERECESGLCIAGSCGLRAVGQSCSATAECASQLCDREECVERTATGNACTADRFCASGSCPAGLCADPVSAYNACRHDGDCMPDLLCVSDGLCHTKGSLENEPCSDHPESCTRSMRCAAGACSTFDGGRCCVPVLNAGEACTQNRDCADGLFCCVENPDAGNAEDRLEFMPCGEGQPGNTCVPATAVGEPCYADQHCTSGRCVEHHDQGPGVCGVTLACD